MSKLIKKLVSSTMNRKEHCKKRCKFWFDCPTDRIPDKTCEALLFRDWTEEEIVKLKEAGYW